MRRQRFSSWPCSWRVCLLVTLIFNLRGKLFLGDSGTYATSLTIGLLTVYTYNMTDGRLYADAVVAWFIVPVIDCLRLMAVRALQRRSPMSPDTNHLHHRLQRLIPKRWVVPSHLGLGRHTGRRCNGYSSVDIAGRVGCHGSLHGQS